MEIGAFAAPRKLAFTIPKTRCNGQETSGLSLDFRGFPYFFVRFPYSIKGIGDLG
jgi:hypothetical protein